MKKGKQKSALLGKLELQKRLIKKSAALEKSKRELKLETSLEKVRTVAMIMSKPDDMLLVCRVIAEQMGLLKVKDIRNVQTAIFYKEKGRYINYEYYVKYNKTFITDVNYKDHQIHRSFAKKMLKGNGASMTQHLKGKELEKWVAYQKTTNVFIDDFLESASSLNYYWYSLGPVALGISTYKPLSDEEVELFRRFLKVFELSYRRFLDIEQAETQAREAQIQLALERVRARTMAMQKSEELAETAFLLFQQFKQLGEAPDQATIGIINEEEWVIEYWVTMYGNQTNRVYQFSIDEPNVTNRIYHAWKNREKSLVIDLSGKELYDFATYRQSMGGAAYNPKEKRRVINVAFFSKGLINVQSNESRSAESIQLLERFASVFEQTYTRFLDLQKAEAQVKEAQIEAALEKVRSRTMAMQSSNELQETATVLFQEFKNLGATNIYQVTIGIYNETEGLVDFRVTDWAGSGDQENRSFLLDMSEPTILKPSVLAWKANKKSIVIDLTGKELEQWIHYRNKMSGVTISSEDTKGRRVISIAYFSKGHISISTPVPVTQETIKTLERFAAVFDGTYTRFLDLEKAEAQTREATIEAAMEKVRGQSMAMRNSNDLSVAASMVFAELRKLGIQPIRSGVGIIDKDSRKVKFYSAASSSSGDSLSLTGEVIMLGHPEFEKQFEAWVKNENYFTVLKGDALESYNHFLFPGYSNPDLNTNVDREQYGHWLMFSEGFLFAWADRAYSEAEINVLDRFKRIIELTFRRYYDLQKSEANTREAIKQASLDRVRADIASMRTTSDLERITPLIWNELTVLGIPFSRCGVFIMDDGQEQIHTFLSTPEGKAIAAFHLPYDSPGNFAEIVAHWQQKKMYISHWGKNDFISLANNLLNQGAVSSIEQYTRNLPSEGIFLHFLPFLQGMLYVGNINQLKEEEVGLIQSLADAFSTAYARYEDFNKLEAAKQQVEKTLVDLKQAQQQLVQSEKMASLGELTAGIAHEIQNPLNFVNNFSEVSTELVDEMNEEMEKGNIEDAKQIAVDLKQNLEKINHHGKRAGDIIKGMLQHSRSSSGQRENTDINKLTDEYFRLAFHGLRAKDKSFNATMKTDYDESIAKIEIIPQDMGRVILNLITNAFYAVTERRKGECIGYEPTVWVSTKKLENQISITVSDNGSGIPQKVVDKIFQPFFTTKPTGQGTGLGLSLSYDIVKAHGGEIKVETKEGEGTSFKIILPNT